MKVPSLFVASQTSESDVFSISLLAIDNFFNIILCWSDKLKS
jgi:hypothetical protein